MFKRVFKFLLNKIEEVGPEITITKQPLISDIVSGNTQCQGCGSIFQQVNEKEGGYIDPKSLETLIKRKEIEEKVKRKEIITMGELRDFEKKEKDLICKRCYQLTYYGKNIDIKPEEFISKLIDKKCLIVFIVDLFDFENSLIDINKIAGENPILLVGNKMDLLPRDVSFERVKVWIRRILKKYDIQVKDVILTSSKKGNNMKKLGYLIEKLRNYRDVYIVGSTNVGKSSLINKYISIFTNTEFNRLTTSPISGTTLKPLSFRIGRGYKKSSSYLFDTPGITNSFIPSLYLSEKEFYLVHPTKKVYPVYFRIFPGRCLFLGGLGRIDFISNKNVNEFYEPIIMTAFVSSHLPLHITSIEKAQDIYEKRLGTVIFPPSPGNIDLTPLIEKETITITGKTRKQAIIDINISGIGWVSITGVGEMTFKIWAPEKLKVFIREPLMPFETVNIKKSDFKEW